MISYEPFYETLKKKNITTYKLIKEFNVSRSLLDRLKHNRPISTVTLNDLCNILHCKVEDILVYTEDDIEFLTRAHGGPISLESAKEHAKTKAAEEIQDWNNTINYGRQRGYEDDLKKTRMYANGDFVEGTKKQQKLQIIL